MRQLSKIQSILFIIGGVLMVIGVGCFVFMVQQLVMCWVFLAGAVLFATMRYSRSMRVRNSRCAGLSVS